jgi:hypothetical protein
MSCLTYLCIHLHSVLLRLNPALLTSSYYSFSVVSRGVHGTLASLAAADKRTNPGSIRALQKPPAFGVSRPSDTGDFETTKVRCVMFAAAYDTLSVASESRATYLQVLNNHTARGVIPCTCYVRGSV